FLFFLTGLLKLVVLVSVLFVVVFLAFELLESNMNLNLGKVLGEFMHLRRVFMNVLMLYSASSPPRHKCGLSKPCPEDHFAFKITSGAASVVGPKICFQDNLLHTERSWTALIHSLFTGKTSELTKTESFDMWSGDVEQLIKFLKEIEDGSIVMMATFDDPGTNTSISILGFRDNWVFVGGKGIKTKSPFEQHIKNNAETNKYDGWPEVLEMEGLEYRL
uniref:Family with sequence similarity 3 member C n=1 Tax=Cyprinus carpio TaxID=7962 RepID=A0A8C2GSG3_CYPCA